MKHQFIAVIVTVASTGMALAWGNCCPNMAPVREKTIKTCPTNKCMTCPTMKCPTMKCTIKCPVVEPVAEYCLPPIGEYGAGCPNLVAGMNEAAKTCPSVRPVCEKIKKCPCPAKKLVRDRCTTCPTLRPVSRCMTCPTMAPVGERIFVADQTRFVRTGYGELRPVGERVIIKKTPARKVMPLRSTPMKAKSDCGCH